MITQVQQDIEDELYKILKEGEIGKKVITKYHHQSIEELADVMTEGFKMSWVSDVVKCLDCYNGVEGFEMMCNAAFKAAMLRVLREST